MKSYSLIFLFTCAVLFFGACGANVEDYHASPKVFISAGVLPTTTLSVYYDRETGLALTDTVRMGDTVRIMFKINAFGFQLKRFHIEKPESFALIDVLSPDSISRIVTLNSSLPGLDFYFLDHISYVAMPINYMPARVSDTDSLVLHIQSDVTTKENTVRQVLRIPVKPKQ
jgi:hypothetical protein